MYIDKIFEGGDWLGKAISEIDTTEGKVISFLRYSSHHKLWSIQYIYEATFKEWNLPEADWFPEEKPSNITICDWID